jgi:hypothetical protein
MEYKYYTNLGNQDYIDENDYPRLDDGSSNKVYAKCSLSRKSKHIVSSTNLGVDKDSYRYYIHINANGEAFDPKAPYQPKANFIKKVCKDNGNFKEVNQYIFNKYIQFLKTNNKRWITEINRDLK